MSTPCVWMNVEGMQDAMRGCRDPRAVAVAVGMLAAYAPDGAGAFRFSPAHVARLCATPRSRLTARAIEGMREDLLRFFVALPDGRWAASPALFVTNDPTEEGAG